MYLKYELACKEASLSEQETKEIRRIFENDRKKLKRKDRIIEQRQYTRISIDSEMTDDERSMAFNIPDPNVNVEEDAINNVNMEKLMKCLDQLDEEEKEIVITFFDKSIVFSKYAVEKGIERTTLKRRAEATVIKIRKMMGVKIEK